MARQRPQSPPPEILVDSHCHVLPPRLASKIRGFFESSGMVSASATPSSCCSVPSDTIPLVYPIDSSTLLSILIAESPSAPHTLAPAIWTLPYAHRADMSLALNASVLELARELTLAGEGKMRVVPGLTVHPGDGEAGRPKAEEVLEAAVRAGAKVAKLHCSVGEYSVMDVRLQRFWQLAEALRLPVVIHAGTSIMGTTASAELDDISTLCAAYPSAPIILAHAGHPSTSRALDLTRLHPNLHLDTTPVISSLVSLPPLPSPPSSPPRSVHFDLPEPTSSTPSLPLHSQLLHLALSHRILFGSDAPNTSISRPTAALAVRHWVRECVSRSMGNLRLEDVGTEMERVAERAEKAVMGGAAGGLEEGVRGVGEARRELGWDGEVRGRL